MAEEHSEGPAIALYDLIVSHRTTATIFVAARLGIADALAAGPRTAPHIAKTVDAHERSVGRLLRALVALGICRQPSPGTFELTPVGVHLAGGGEQSLKAYALFEGEWLWRGWGELLVSVKTGKASWELAGAKDRFAAMAKNPAEVRIFNDAMSSVTSITTPALLAAYDFSGIAYLMDVGGGSGEMLGAILRANPSMRGAVFDLPRCEALATARLAEAGVADRSEFIAGDFFESVPTKADAIIMKSVIHDWNDERSVTILTNCRRALPPGGRLLLFERVMREPVGANAYDLSNAMGDLNMLRGPGGAERTEREYRDLLQASGFDSIRVIPAGRFNVIEATAS